jgi:hypothetical protein
MSRVLNVARLQLINKQTFIWVPMIILVGAVLLSIAIFWIVPSDTVIVGAAQAPLWYFFAVGLSALTLTFPFSQALSITRREFFLGTMLIAVLGSTFLALMFVLLGQIELATDGWGLGGYAFYLPWMWEGGAFAAGLEFFTMAMLFFLAGFLGATIYKRSGPLVITLVSVGFGVLLVGVLFFITRLDLWAEVGAAFASLGALGLAMWGLLLVAVMAATSFLVLRGATP